MRGKVSFVSATSTNGRDCSAPNPPNSLTLDAKDPQFMMVSPLEEDLDIPFASTLLQLVNDCCDDEWIPVLERIRAHADEILVTGTKGNHNALHAAIMRYPPLHIVQAMVEARPDAAIMRLHNGETALHLACYCAGEEVQMAIVKAVPEAASLVDHYGEVPLHFCARQGASFGMMQTLLEAAPEMIGQRNYRNVTPFWLLPRSYLEVEMLREILQAEEEEEDCVDDWNLLVLFLRYSYFGRDPVAPRADTYATTPVYDWLVPAAASTPSCPREVLRWLCRLFPDQAVRYDKDGYTPLIRGCQAPEVLEPICWDDAEDGFREHVEISVGQLQNLCDLILDEEKAAPSADVEFLLKMLAQCEGIDTSERVVEILLEWSPRSAIIADQPTNMLPLVHALIRGKAWPTIRALIHAYPGALEVHVDGMSTFLLAAQYSPQLTTVYTLVRSLPTYLQSARHRLSAPPQKKHRTD